MARVQIKHKAIRATLGDSDVTSMFNDVMGNSEGSRNVCVAYPKYKRIMHESGRFLKLLAVARDSTAFVRFPEARHALAAYVNTLEAQYREAFCAPDLDACLRAVAGPAATLEAKEDYYKLDAPTVGEFLRVFNLAKECNLVNIILVTCQNLVTHKKSLSDLGELRDRFITKHAGIVLSPLPDLPQVNFKQMYLDDRLSADEKEYLLIVLSKLYTISYDVYNAVSAPDVDVDEFIEVITSSIGEVRKHIPRCDGAFNKIVESVSMLKSNFGGYYKDYVSSGDSSLIMQNFVLDVSQKHAGSSATLAGQFNRIIGHYRKIAGQQKMDPKLRNLMSHADKHYDELRKREKAADKADVSDESEDDVAESAAATSTTTPMSVIASMLDLAAAAPAAPAQQPAGMSLAAELDAEDAAGK